MKRSTLLGGAAFSLALAGGATAGALLGTPATSGAQDDTPSTTTVDEPARTRGGPGFGFRGDCLEAAAEVLGMGEDELLEELRDGRTLAEVAEARGVDVDEVVDALVAAGTERLEAAIDELPERMQDLVEGELPVHGPRRGFGPGGPGGPGGPRDHAEPDDADA